jgi:16S rRNA (uracil1498-N3)-methyltransferase
MVPLARLLDSWEAPRRIMFCDEALAGERGELPEIHGPWAVLVGPEGGFSEAERKRLHGLDDAHPVRLGPRILRADTATVAALTLWQHKLGDWI